MAGNVPQDQPASKSAINKQILEIKKKIQLSEGQRKALFEECEEETKSNADEILRLKREIAQLVLSLNENRSASLKNHAQLKRLEVIIGPADKKTSSEAQQLLDLQIIDKSKQLDLLRYRIRQKQKYLTELGNEYQVLISDRVKKRITERIENPVKKATCDLTNNIHAIELQHREAEHIRIRYRDIKKSLEDDAAKFEGRIREIEEQIRIQRNDIARLQQINTEASRLRSIARGVLLKEERAALSKSAARDRRTIEGRRIVEKQREQLEKLERRFFQGGKAPTAKQDVDETAAEDAIPPTETPEEVQLHPVEIMNQYFEVLKRATGAISTEEVLTRFYSQKETLARLSLLRKTNEDHKQRLEARRDKLAMEFEKLKYAEVQDTEQNALEMEKIQLSIEKEKETSRRCEDDVKKINDVVSNLSEALYNLHFLVNPETTAHEEPLTVVQFIIKDLEIILHQIPNIEEISKPRERGEEDVKWLPNPYTALLSKTPLPQQGASPAPQQPPGSEDEEEVPSRGFLKRQAQIVVDAKLRRKNVHMLPRK